MGRIGGVAGPQRGLVGPWGSRVLGDWLGWQVCGSMVWGRLLVRRLKIAQLGWGFPGPGAALCTCTDVQ